MIRSCQHWTWAPLAAGVNYIYQANYVIGFAVWGQETWTKQSWIKDLHYDCGWVTWWKAVIKNFLQLLLSLVWYNKKNLGSKSYLVINTRVVWINFRIMYVNYARKTCHVSLIVIYAVWCQAKRSQWWICFAYNFFNADIRGLLS